MYSEALQDCSGALFPGSVVNCVNSNDCVYVIPEYSSRVWFDNSTLRVVSFQWSSCNGSNVSDLATSNSSCIMATNRTGDVKSLGFSSGRSFLSCPNHSDSCSECSQYDTFVQLRTSVWLLSRRCDTSPGCQWIWMSRRFHHDGCSNQE